MAFTWAAGASATAYWLDIGSAAGGNNYYSSGNLGTALTTTVNGLPTTGSAVYATLYSLIGGVWTPNATSYTAYSLAGAGGVMTSPPNGSMLSDSQVVFSWSAGAGASAYWLDVGNTSGGNNYYTSGNLGGALTTTVSASGLPSRDASTVYATLYSLIGGQWYGTTYTYTALNPNHRLSCYANASAGFAPERHLLVTFTWSADAKSHQPIG